MRKRQLYLLLLALGTSSGQRGLRILYKRSRPGESAVDRFLLRPQPTNDTLTEEGTDDTGLERHSDEPEERNVFVTSVNETPGSSPSLAPGTITESPSPSEGGESNVTLIPTMSPAPSAVVTSTDSPTVSDFGNTTEAPTVDVGNMTDAPTVEFGNMTDAPDDLGNMTDAPSMVGADGESTETPDVDARLSLRQSSDTVSSVEPESTVSRWRRYFPSFSEGEDITPYVWVAPKSGVETLETSDSGEIEWNP